MPHARVIESCAIVVHSHRAIRNLVPSVAIHIRHAQVVVALSCIAGPLRVIGVKHPALFQFTSVPVPCRQYRACVVATTEHRTRRASAKIAHRCQIALRPVATVVAPAVHIASLRHIRLRVHHLARHAVKHTQVFRSRQDAPSRVAIVGQGVANHLSFRVARAVSRLHHQFRPSVAVQVIYDERRIVRSAADVPSQVNAPESFAIQAIAVNQRGICHAVMTIVVRVPRVPFQDNLILSVAIHIRHRRIVGRVQLVRLLQRNGDVADG